MTEPSPPVKLLLLLWPDAPLTPAMRRERLLSVCAPEILQLQPLRLSMSIDDEHAQYKSPAPKLYRDAPLAAAVSVTFAKAIPSEQQQALLDMLNAQGFKAGCYSVEESIYCDYGDNEHHAPRDWPDGQRSPTLLTVTLLTRPQRLSQQEWIRRWHGKMSPVSERLQPRARYVRNVITAHTPGSPAFDGMVEEAWPSPEHVSNPYLFYRASNPLQLVWHILQMLRVVTHFHALHKIRTVTMSEYFIKS